MAYWEDISKSVDPVRQGNHRWEFGISHHAQNELGNLVSRNKT